jgi:hypothetical protein
MPTLHHVLQREHTVTKSMNRIHARIVFGGVVLLVGFAAWIFLLDGGRFLPGVGR